MDIASNEILMIENINKSTVKMIFIYSRCPSLYYWNSTLLTCGIAF